MQQMTLLRFIQMFWHRTSDLIPCFVIILLNLMLAHWSKTITAFLFWNCWTNVSCLLSQRTPSFKILKQGSLSRLNKALRCLFSLFKRSASLSKKSKFCVHQRKVSLSSKFWPILWISEEHDSRFPCQMNSRCSELDTPTLS